MHVFNLSIHFWFWLLQIYFQGALKIILLSRNLASGVLCARVCVCVCVYIYIYMLVDLLCFFFRPSCPRWSTFNAVRVRGRCCVLGVVTYKCTYSFFSPFPASVISSSYVLNESRKCKKCQIVSLLLFSVGTKFHELLLAQG